MSDLPQPTQQQMENAMMAAASACAEVANMSTVEVLEAIKNGDEAIRNSVIILMFAALSPDVSIKSEYSTEYSNLVTSSPRRENFDAAARLTAE